MMIGSEGFACTVNPKRNLNGATARCPADGDGEVAPGVQAATAAAAADISTLRRVSRSWLMLEFPSLPFAMPTCPRRRAVSLCEAPYSHAGQCQSRIDPSAP